MRRNRQSDYSNFRAHALRALMSANPMESSLGTRLTYSLAPRSHGPPSASRAREGGVWARDSTAHAQGRKGVWTKWHNHFETNSSGVWLARLYCALAVGTSSRLVCVRNGALPSKVVSRVSIQLGSLSTLMSLPTCLNDSNTCNSTLVPSLLDTMQTHSRMSNWRLWVNLCMLCSIMHV